MKSKIKSYQDLEVWQKAAPARYCHPREEHMLPLHVCLGMANKATTMMFDDYILGKRAIAFLW
jgi:4,5-DOPA dioxygenase extradiol